jgi:hypothetical protein
MKIPRNKSNRLPGPINTFNCKITLKYSVEKGY